MQSKKPIEEIKMSTDSRLVRLETMAESTQRVLDSLDKRLYFLEEKLDKKFEKIDLRFDQMERKFEQVEQRFDQINNRFEGVDKKFDLVRLELCKNIKSVDDRLSRFQLWIVGIGVSAFLSVGGEILNIAMQLHKG